MAEQEDAGEGEIEVTVETEVIDVDEDGVPDIVSEVTTIVADLDGDGVPDVIEVLLEVLRLREHRVARHVWHAPDAHSARLSTGVDVDGVDHGGEAHRA